MLDRRQQNMTGYDQMGLAVQETEQNSTGIFKINIDPDRHWYNLRF